MLFIVPSISHLDPEGHSSGWCSATLSSMTLLSVARRASRRAAMEPKDPEDSCRVGMGLSDDDLAPAMWPPSCEAAAGVGSSRTTSLSVALLEALLLPKVPEPSRCSCRPLNDDSIGAPAEARLLRLPPPEKGGAPAEARLRLPPPEKDGGGGRAPLNPAEERLRESPTATQSSCTPDRLS